MRGGIKVVIRVYIKKVNTKEKVDLATPLPLLTIRTMRATIAKSKNHDVVEHWARAYQLNLFEVSSILM